MSLFLIYERKSCAWLYAMHPRGGEKDLLLEFWNRWLSPISPLPRSSTSTMCVIYNVCHLQCVSSSSDYHPLPRSGTSTMCVISELMSISSGCNCRQSHEEVFTGQINCRIFLTNKLLTDLEKGKTPDQCTRFFPNNNAFFLVGCMQRSLTAITNCRSLAGSLPIQPLVTTDENQLQEPGS